MQKEHASECEIRLPRGNVTRVCSELEAHQARVAFPRGRRFSRSLACSFCSTIPVWKERLFVGYTFWGFISYLYPKHFEKLHQPIVLGFSIHLVNND